MNTNIFVWGLGHVGRITATFLCDLGYSVYAIDKNKTIISNIYKGNIRPNCLSNEMNKYIHLGLLKTHEKLPYCIKRHKRNVHFICVDTPTNSDGSQDCSSILHTLDSIIDNKINNNDLIIVRSTILPTTTIKVILPYIQKSSKFNSYSSDMVAVNPCFIRHFEYEEDLKTTNRVVIGTESEKTFQSILRIYKMSKCKVVSTSCTEAELVKYIDNCFHGLKVAFANEVDLLAKQLNCDGMQIMNTICLDKRLNISEKYLSPGLPYGGGCLPKDIRAIESFILKCNMHLPLLCKIEESNESNINSLLEEKPIKILKN